MGRPGAGRAAMCERVRVRGAKVRGLGAGAAARSRCRPRSLWWSGSFGLCGLVQGALEGVQVTVAEVEAHRGVDVVLPPVADGDAVPEGPGKFRVVLPLGERLGQVGAVLVLGRVGVVAGGDGALDGVEQGLALEIGRASCR